MPGCSPPPPQGHVLSWSGCALAGWDAQRDHVASKGPPLPPHFHVPLWHTSAASPAGPRHWLSQTGRFGLKRGDLDPLQLRERELGVLHKAFQPYSPAKLSAWKWSGIHLLLLKSSFGLWETKCLSSNTSSKAPLLGSPCPVSQGGTRRD